MYLEDFGAVFKGVRVADIIDQADNVAGQISIGQVVEVGEYFMKLRRGEERRDYLLPYITYKYKLLLFFL